MPWLLRDVDRAIADLEVVGAGERPVGVGDAADDVLAASSRAINAHDLETNEVASVFSPEELGDGRLASVAVPNQRVVPSLAHQAVEGHHTLALDVHPC